jgi:hypothetical protein
MPLLRDTKPSCRSWRFCENSWWAKRAKAESKVARLVRFINRLPADSSGDYILHPKSSHHARPDRRMPLFRYERAKKVAREEFHSPHAGKGSRTEERDGCRLRPEPIGPGGDPAGCRPQRRISFRLRLLAMVNMLIQSYSLLGLAGCGSISPNEH